MVAFEALGPTTATGSRGQRYLTERPRLAHSNLLAVVERYVFLTTGFPGRPSFAPDQAIARMLADAELDGRLVRAFASAASLVPAGARARITDGREALVVSAPLSVSSTDPLVLRVVGGGRAERPIYE